MNIHSKSDKRYILYQNENLIL